MTAKISEPFLGKYPISFKFGEAPAWYVKVFGYPHNGVDFALPLSTPVMACDGGRVAFADSVPDADGEGIVLEHVWGRSIYWHLSGLSATFGQQVERGATIGLSGATGFVTGPHLHFGLKVMADYNQAMKGFCDPLNYIDFTDPQPPLQLIKPVYHLVLPGQSLYSIAQKFYGDGAYWRKIYQANLDKIKDPALIYPFQKLLIP